MSISPPQKPSFSFLFTVEAPMVDRMKAARVSSLAGGVDLTEKCGPFKCHRLQSVFHLQQKQSRVNKQGF